MTITCSIQPTGVVTMAMKKLHNTYNMCIPDLPDMNALIPQPCSPRALDIHIRQSLMSMLQPLFKLGLLLIHCASYLIKLIFFIIAFIIQFDKTIIVDSIKFHCCFQNVIVFVKSILCTISLPIMLALCWMLLHPIMFKIILAYVIGSSLTVTIKNTSVIA